MSSRTHNFTCVERKLLLSIAEKYQNIIENKTTNATSLNKRRESWVQITNEFNSNCDVNRSVKQIKNLYFNMKRKLRKDVAAEHRDDYVRAKQTAALDKREMNKTGGGSYNPKLDEIGAQLLAIVGDQVEPLSNIYDDAASYFGEDVQEITLDDEIPIHLSQNSPEPALEMENLIETELIDNPQEKRAASVKKLKNKKIKKKVDYKQLYFKKKYQVACFELKSKKIIHNLDVKIKRKQLEILQ